MTRVRVREMRAVIGGQPKEGAGRGVQCIELVIGHEAMISVRSPDASGDVGRLHAPSPSAATVKPVIATFVLRACTENGAHVVGWLREREQARPDCPRVLEPSRLNVRARRALLDARVQCP
jgi:hypothetical protein